MHEHSPTCLYRVDRPLLPYPKNETKKKKKKKKNPFVSNGNTRICPPFYFFYTPSPRLVHGFYDDDEDDVEDVDVDVDVDVKMGQEGVLLVIKISAGLVLLSTPRTQQASLLNFWTGNKPPSMLLDGG